MSLAHGSGTVPQAHQVAGGEDNAQSTEPGALVD